MKSFSFLLLTILLMGGVMTVMAADSLSSYVDSHLVWLGQSGFRLTSNSGQVLYFDPYKVADGLPKADLVLVSHAHQDHFDESSLAKLQKQGTTIVTPETMVKPGFTGITAGKTLQVGEFTVTAVRAYNMEKKFHPKSNNWVGYVVAVDGIKIYHAGDTDFIPEMQDLQPDIALLPVGGTYTMDVAEAAKAAAAIKAKLYIPMHYGSVVGSPQEGAKFVGLVKAGVVKVLPVQSL